MVINKKSYCLLLVFCSVLFSCTGDKLNYKSYLKYLADPENGITKERATHGIKLKVKYLPLNYLVYNAVKSVDNGVSKEELEKIKKSYANSLTFMLTLGPDDNESFSITNVGVENYEQFAQRIETMSFNMKEYIRLNVNNKQYVPELVQMETINTLEPSKNLIIVFNTLDEKGKEIKDNDMTFVYNDELFYTGINKFIFKAKDLKAVPELDLQLTKQ